jgi:hypothetical protein
MTIRSLHGAVIAAALFLLSAAATPGPLAAGPCGYRYLSGSAHIVSVGKTKASSAQASTAGGPGYEGLEVRFAFTPEKPIADADLKEWAAREHTFKLANSWYPGARYVEKYGLSAGKTIPAVLAAIVQGTCTPFLFEFPAIDRADYFETAK